MRTVLLATVLLVLGSACTTPAPRVPFKDAAWHASVFGGRWEPVSTFVDDADAIGIEYILEEPGTSGWAFEIGARYANGEKDTTRAAIDPISGVRDLAVPSHREIDYYEFDLGVRQTYRGSDILQPYFGVGGSLLQGRSKETWIQPAVPGSVDFPTDTPQSDHERSEIRPGIYGRTGFVWNVLRDQVRDETEFPIAFDMRGLLSVDTCYLEFTLGFGFGR